MFTPQFTPQEWYMSVPDKIVAEFMMNRLVGRAELINLNGLNMRLKPTVT